jgi:hypothetical protein
MRQLVLAVDLAARRQPRDRRLMIEAHGRPAPPPAHDAEELTDLTNESPAGA